MGGKRKAKVVVVPVEEVVEVPSPQASPIKPEVKPESPVKQSISSSEEEEEEPVKKKRAMTAGRQAALDKANAARLRKKIERELQESQKKEAEYQQKLEEQVLAIIKKHAKPATPSPPPETVLAVANPQNDKALVKEPELGDDGHQKYTHNNVKKPYHARADEMYRLIFKR